ncbi:hypothetical protein L3Q82_011254 [Scortum barcoo]|uniref:Uncharacterized protein n=1 Tax=Scortum barcoo TaxID=214431 RepID=A0ACB8WB24_9TELE|nr:hypothetical protein L3Q82_011254 [Scortum barcoo]
MCGQDDPQALFDLMETTLGKPGPFQEMERQNRRHLDSSPSASTSTVFSSQQNMTTNSTGSCKVPNEYTYKAFSGLVIMELMLGLPLNLSVLYVFVFRFKFWKNKSVYLFNIVVADFLLVACLPFKAYDYYNGYRCSQNPIMCKTMLFMLFLNRGASIAFLIILSIDRYLKVVHLGRRNFHKVLKKSPQVSIVIWLLLLPLTIPTLVETFEYCNLEISTVYDFVTVAFREIIFFTQIIIPFIVLVYCTVRIVNRLKMKTVGDKTKLRRAMYVVKSVVIVFSISFLPYAIARAVLLGVQLKAESTGKVAIQVHDGLLVLSYINCLLDPLVYCFCNSGFKDAYISAICPTCLQKRLMRTDFGLGTTTTTTTGARMISLPVTEK